MHGRGGALEQCIDHARVWQYMCGGRIPAVQQYSRVAHGGVGAEQERNKSAASQRRVEQLRIRWHALLLCLKLVWQPPPSLASQFHATLQRTRHNSAASKSSPLLTPPAHPQTHQFSHSHSSPQLATCTWPQPSNQFHTQGISCVESV